MMKPGVSASVACLLVTTLSHAQPEPDEQPAAALTAPPPSPALVMPLAYPPSDSAPQPRVEPRYDFFRVGIGFRIGRVGDAAFDTFADDDILAQGSLEATYAFYTRGKLALASGVIYDVGSRTAGARGLSTRLTVHRVSVPLEARWYLAPWLNGFVKVAPGAAAYNARLADPSSSAPLKHAPWAFAADLSAGASIRLAGGGNLDRRRARLWLTTELGYGVTSSRDLRLGPDRDEKDVLGTDESTKLGSLAVSGVFWRTGVAVSF